MSCRPLRRKAGEPARLPVCITCNMCLMSLSETYCAHGGCRGGGVRQVDAQMTLPSEWQLDHPVSRAVVGADGMMRKDVCWLPPGCVMDLYAQFQAPCLKKTRSNATCVMTCCNVLV